MATIHCLTAQAGIAISGWSRRQTENNYRNCSEEATRRAKNVDESPQDGATPVQKIAKKLVEESARF